MTGDPELAFWLRLVFVPGLGPQGQRKLLSDFGLPSRVFAADYPALTKCIGDELARRLLAHDAGEQIAAALAWSSEPDHHILTLADSAYPAALLEIPNPPTLLYVLGKADLLARPMLAVVGSRNATAQGLSNAEQFSAALSHAGLTIVSGLALGIDAAAHRGALSAPASTVAVLGTGVDVRYPTRNAPLYEAIAKGGALVSEFPIGTAAISLNFPRRNRIISGLSKGVLVIEAALSSGSLITARYAGEQGRELFAIPGSIHSPLSKGCHALIKQGAKLVDSAQDVLEELGAWRATPSPEKAESPHAASEHGLLQHLGHDPCSIDILCSRSGLTPDSVSAILLELELDGTVACLPGGRYQRIP